MRTRFVVSALLWQISCVSMLPQVQQLLETTTFQPQPFKFAFSASRLPGAQPDRYQEAEGDADGVVRGSYAYLDPNYKWQQVQYVADKDGFHVDPALLPVANPVVHPKDTVAVTSARLQHQQLFDAIALRNSQAPVNVVQNLPVESAAVANVRNQFHAQFDQIAAEHARIAAEHEKLAAEEERLKLLQN